MRDSHFQQVVREALDPAAGITEAEYFSLGVEIFPSARMPGFVLVRVSGFNMSPGLEKIEAAVAAGKVSVWFAHEDACTSALTIEKGCNVDAMPRTKFTARPHTDDLPPISRYIFYINGDYDTYVCNPNSFGYCTDEFVKQELIIILLR